MPKSLRVLVLYPLHYHFVPMGVLSRTPIAAIQFKAFSGVHKRVYYQDDVGNIRETCYDEDRGWFIPDADIVGVGRLNTGIAAVTWGNGTQVIPGCDSWS